MLRKTFLLFTFFILTPSFAFTETIDVQIKGVDDGVKTTKQQDYKEAVLFAKREAIERAGVKVKALTTAKDFVVQSDYIESQAEAVLLPGYNIIDVGYTADGTYQIVLIGKVKTASKEVPGISEEFFTGSRWSWDHNGWIFFEIGGKLRTRWGGGSWYANKDGTVTAIFPGNSYNHTLKFDSAFKSFVSTRHDGNISTGKLLSPHSLLKTQ